MSSSTGRKISNALFLRNVLQAGTPRRGGILYFSKVDLQYGPKHRPCIDEDRPRLSFCKTISTNNQQVERY